MEQHQQDLFFEQFLIMQNQLSQMNHRLDLLVWIAALNAKDPNVEHEAMNRLLDIRKGD